MEPWEDMTPSPMSRRQRRIVLIEQRRCASYVTRGAQQLASVLAVGWHVDVSRHLLDVTDARLLHRSDPYPADATLYASHRMRTLRQLEKLRRLYADAEAALFGTGPIDATLCNTCPDERYTADLVFQYLGRGGLVGELTVDAFDRGRRGESLLAADRAPVAVRGK